MRVKYLVVSCLLTAGAAQAADLRAFRSSSAAGGAPPTVQDAAPPAVQDANAGNPFPCLFGCSDYQSAQAAAAPPEDVSPRKEAKRKWPQHAFAQTRSTKQEGRSVAAARKISRSVAPQSVTYRPTYDAPLDADAVPMEWQLRAEPPKAGGTTQPAMKVGPFGGLK